MIAMSSKLSFARAAPTQHNRRAQTIARISFSLAASTTKAAADSTSANRAHALPDPTLKPLQRWRQIPTLECSGVPWSSAE